MAGQGGETVHRHRRIGLLGGSFNPAHRGHLHISRLALRLLDLEEVWWLVSPQNPLKPVAGMAPFAARLQRAAAIAAGDRRITVSDWEARLGTAFTVDTIAALQRRFPRHRFVWLIGADNLAQLPDWKRWQDIFGLVPIAVFDRPGAAAKALSGMAAQRFRRHRLMPGAARRLAEKPPPAWAFFHTRLDPHSATRFRAERTPPPRKEKRRHVIATALSAAARAPLARPAIPPAELLGRIVASLEDGKAADIVAIDLAGKTLIADYMVIASGRSARQVVSLTEHLEQALAGRHIAIEGKAHGDWVLIDAGDVIVHIFRPEIRAYYNLEKMWGDWLPDIEAVRQ